MKLLNRVSMEEASHYELNALGVVNQFLYVTGFRKLYMKMWKRKYDRYLREIIAEANAQPAPMARQPMRAPDEVKAEHDIDRINRWLHGGNTQ